jgi:hypothetical protein
MIDDEKLKYKSIFIDKEILFKDVKKIEIQYIFSMNGYIPTWYKIVDNNNKALRILITQKLMKSMPHINTKFK